MDRDAASRADSNDQPLPLPVTGSVPSGQGSAAGGDDDHTAVAGGVQIRPAEAIGTGFVLAERYQIEVALGEGGSGTVYRAWDRILGELVAVKILHPQRAREKSWIRRLAREVKVARAIGHPNVCRVFELGHSEDHWFVTMELATGGSLRDMLRAPIPVARTLGERLRDIRELCAGLAAMHAVAITHRDVTPQNVLRMADGRMVLTDFGLAVERDDQTTTHGGTPAYMPPEAARGERSDQRSDVFQLGMIMHEVLTGVRPMWKADGSRLKLVEPAPGAGAVEEELLHLIAECVDPDPARRPPSAVAVAGRLAAAEVARPAPLPVRMVRRGRRVVRQHPRLLATLAATVVFAGVVRSVQVLSRPPLCRGAVQQLAGIWDPGRAEAVRRSFASSGKAYATDTFTRVRTILDQYASDWERMYTDACEATNLRGEQSAEVLDLRMTCLKEHQGELRALTDLFLSSDKEMVSRYINAASGLTPVSRCGDVAILRAVVKQPGNPEAHAKVEALREQIAEVRALGLAGRIAEGAQKAKLLVEQARAIGYEPVLAEALEALGQIQRWTGPYPETAAALDEAMLVAEASHHDRLLAEAAVDKVALLASHDSFDDLNRLLPRAQATVRRIGGDPRLQGWISNDTAVALGHQGKYAEALEMDRQALEAKLRVLPADHWDVGLSRGNIADDLHSLGRLKEALAENESAVTILERALGHQHPELAGHIYNRGEIRLALGRISEAREDFARSLSLFTTELPANHLSLSYPLTGLGLAALAAGEGVERAIPGLERALEIRKSSAARADLQAETMFALARALWEAGQNPKADRLRAIKLAEAARELIPVERTQERREVESALALWAAKNRPTSASRSARNRESSLRHLSTRLETPIQ